MFLTPASPRCWRLSSGCRCRIARWGRPSTSTFPVEQSSTCSTRSSNRGMGRDSARCGADRPRSKSPSAVHRPEAARVRRRLDKGRHSSRCPNGYQTSLGWRTISRGVDASRLSADRLRCAARASPVTGGRRAGLGCDQRFEIVAKADGLANAPSGGARAESMMRTLLADRFRLEIHARAASSRSSIWCSIDPMADSGRAFEPKTASAFLRQPSGRLPRTRAGGADSGDLGRARSPHAA